MKLTGGIYLDLDSLPLKSFDHLRNYSATQGLYSKESLSNAVIVGSPQNIFHWLVYLSYCYYNSKLFGFNSVNYPMQIAKMYPALVHVEYSYILRPNEFEIEYLIRDNWLWNWSLHYTVHVFASW